jgi:CRISPR/Cas system-associated protein Cas10 (large subunit of type III CRISPR-Cas system)
MMNRHMIHRLGLMHQHGKIANMNTCQLCGKHEDERNTQEQMGYTICSRCDGLYSDEELQDKMEQSS